MHGEKVKEERVLKSTVLLHLWFCKYDSIPLLQITEATSPVSNTCLDANFEMKTYNISTRDQSTLQGFNKRFATTP